VFDIKSSLHKIIDLHEDIVILCLHLFNDCIKVLSAFEVFVCHGGCVKNVFLHGQDRTSIEVIDFFDSHLVHFLPFLKLKFGVSWPLNLAFLFILCFVLFLLLLLLFFFLFDTVSLVEEPGDLWSEI